MEKKHIAIIILLTLILGALTFLVVRKNNKIREAQEAVDLAFSDITEPGTPVFDFQADTYGEVKISDKFVVSFCSIARLTEDGAEFYFTADENNEGYLSMTVFDADGNEIGKSGLIRPGEYLRYIPINGEHKTGEYEVKIYTYEKETYYSLGTIKGKIILVADESSNASAEP